MPDKSNPYMQSSPIEFQAFICNNGLVQDSCMLVLVCVIGTLREFQACFKGRIKLPLPDESNLYLQIEFQAFSSNNGLVQDSCMLLLWYVS